MVTFPLAVLDFEASSLGDERSYPIEAGLAIAAAADPPIRVWSSLIRPAAAWVASGDWSARSAAVHGIAPRDLDMGGSPAEVATALNERAAGIPIIWCDGGEYDAHWLRRLYEAARIRPTFRLCDLSGLFVLDRRRMNRYADALGAAAPAHRAGADAERICAALISSLTR